MLGDEAELFRSYHRSLTRTVQHLVRTSPEIVDDACNFAWMEFLRHQPDRHGNWRAWLVTTAQREAWKLDGKERAHTRFAERDDGVTREPADPRGAIPGRRTTFRPLKPLVRSVGPTSREEQCLRGTTMSTTFDR